MNGQTAEVAGSRASAEQSEAAGEIILPVSPLAGGADGDDRLGLERAAQPRRVVVGKRVETHRLIGGEVQYIRLGDRRLIDVIQLECLPFPTGAILDFFAARGVGAHAQNIHRRTADRLVQERLLGRAHLADAAVAGKLERARLAGRDVHLERIALGVADDHSDVALVQPAASGVAAHRVAEPGRSLEAGRWSEHRPASLDGDRASIARRDLPDLGQ